MLSKIFNKIINLPEKKEFDTSRLPVLSLEFKPSKYRPRTLISPSTGLINDPCGIFYRKGVCHIYFQHHPLNPIHGLKFYSLAKTTDFINYEYEWLKNVPDTKNDSHGCFTGSIFTLNNQPYLLYSGNVRNQKWERTATVILGKIDEKNDVSQKKFLFSNLNFKPDATSDFRDPYIFKYQDRYYLLLGHSNSQKRAEIWLYEWTHKTNNINLIKKFSVSDPSYHMAECPNVAFFNNKAVIVVGLQRKKENKNDLRKQDITVYYRLTIDTFFSPENSELNDFKILDYGYELYASQIFQAPNNNYKIISWIGLPGFSEYLEKNDERWVHHLSPVKTLEFKENKLFLKFDNAYLDQVNQLNETNVFSKQISLKDKDFQHNFYDLNRQILSVTYSTKEKAVTIERKYFPVAYPYDQVRKIKITKGLKNLTYFFDKSYFEISFNDGEYNASGRLYADNPIEIMGTEKQENKKRGATS